MSAGTGTKSLNSFVNWTHVLPLLGGRLTTTTLPACVQCPVCHGQRLRILNDPTYGGQWHSCSDCHSTGELLELAANTWKLSLHSTIAKLISLGVEFPAERATPQAVETHERLYWQSRRRVVEGWAKAQTVLQGSKNSLGPLLAKLALRTDLTGDRFRKGPGQLLGGIWRDDAERLYQNYTGYAVGKRHGSLANPSPYRLLRGQKWGQCLVTPYWDFPNRLRGLLFIGRNGDPAAGDFVYREQPLDTRGYQTRVPTAKPYFTDSGLAMHPGVLAAGGSKEWNNTIVAVSDPLQMLRLQFRNFRTSDKPLPLVAWRHEGNFCTTHAWEMLTGRRTVLWSPTLTPSVVWQALLHNFDISLAGPDTPGPHALQQWLVSRPSTTTLKQVIRDSRPWPEIVSAWLLTADVPQVEELFHTLRLWGQPTDPLVEALSEEAQARVKRIFVETAQPLRCTAVNRSMITEQGDAWFEKTGRYNEFSLIVDGLLRIEQVIHQKEQDRTYYQGKIIYKGQALPFCERKETIEKSPALWMQKQLLAKGLGLLQYNPRWTKHLLNVALLLHPPQFVQAVDVVGWCNDTMHFVFPTFSISHTGETKPMPLQLLTLDTPAKSLRQPTLLSPLELQTLTESTLGNSVAWALTLLTITEAVAPVYGRTAGGLVLAGNGIEVAAQHLAPMLGWNIQLYAAGTEIAPLAHRWQTLLIGENGTLALTRRLQQLKHRQGYAAALPWSQSAAVYVNGGWSMAEFESMVELPPEWKAGGCAIIPSYLKDLAERRFELAGKSSRWHRDVHADVADWITRIGGNGATVQDAAKRISNDNEIERADTFGDLLARLHVDGTMATAREGYLTPRGKLCTISRESGDLFIPKEALALLARRNVLLDDAAVSQLLSQAERLVGEDEYDDKHGWLVRSEWWAKRLRRWRTVGLKLHTGS